MSHIQVQLSPHGLLQNRLLSAIWHSSIVTLWEQIFITLYKVASLSKTWNLRIAELAERSPIIIQNSSNPSSRKKFGCTTVRTTLRPYKVLLLTCVVNCTAGTPTPRLWSVVQWSVHWAPSRTTQTLVLAGARRCALETYGKKNANSAFRLG